MTLLVVGSLALDTVITPTDRRDNVLGGSAVFFAYAASFFSPVRLTGVVGDDWPEAHTRLLQSRNIDLAGLSVIRGKKTFRWRGRYHTNLNDRDTLEVQLNVFGEFNPVLPQSFRNSQYVFLANGAPDLQMSVLDQVERPRLVVADTMDLWIIEHSDRLHRLLPRLDGIVLNDSEARLLTGKSNLVEGARRVLELGPKFVVIKKGEHGAIYCDRETLFALPGYPLERVVDPTGAGDTFAGAMMGYLATTKQTSREAIKRSLVYGTLMASFCVEDFSLQRLQQINLADVDARLGQFRTMLAV